MAIIFQIIKCFCITAQLLEQRIENVVKSSENICNTYPDTETYVKNEVQKLKNRWDDLKERTKQQRKITDLTIDYYKYADDVSINI